MNCDQLGLPVNVDLAINQGATFKKRWQWSTGTPAVPVDLTGCDAVIQFRKDYGAPLLAQFDTTTTGGIVLGGTTGTVDLTISATTTSSFTWSMARYDLLIVFPDGTATRLSEGFGTVSPEITQWLTPMPVPTP